MTLAWSIAAIHLLALVIGSAGIGIRAFALRRIDTDPGSLKTAFVGDSLWGIAAILWIGSGIWRAFGGLEKGTAYYLGSIAFWQIGRASCRERVETPVVRGTRIREQ